MFRPLVSSNDLWPSPNKILQILAHVCKLYLRKLHTAIKNFLQFSNFWYMEILSKLSNWQTFLNFVYIATSSYHKAGFIKCKIQLHTVLCVCETYSNSYIYQLSVNYTNMHLCYQCEIIFKNQHTKKHCQLPKGTCQNNLSIQALLLVLAVARHFLLFPNSSINIHLGLATWIDFRWWLFKGAWGCWRLFPLYWLFRIFLKICQNGYLEFACLLSI